MCLLSAAIKSPPQPNLRHEDPEATTYATGFVAPSPGEIAKYFPQLEVLELLGQGGMGAVYKARQRRLDRLVALKILPPDAGRDPAFAERFTREARALARLSHPHIVSVHDFGETESLYYFIMEFVDGANLRQVLEANRLQPDQAIPIVPQICDALQYAHDEGIVHRDIKPENILLDKKGRVKIADFGLAKLLGAMPHDIRLTGTRQVMGTPHYMAPEQLEKPLAVDHRADIYSLGVVFYEMLTGELPLGRFALPSEKVAVDGRLDEVVLRALEKEPDRRYQRASEMQTDVAAITAGGPFPTAVPLYPTTPVLRRSGIRAISVPFKSDGGFTEGHGLIRLDGSNLTLEFVNHTLFFKSPLNIKTIPIQDIATMVLRKGRLTLTAHHYNVLAGIPGSSPGQVQLSITKDNRDAAEQLVAMVSKLWQDPSLPPVEALRRHIQAHAVKGPNPALRLLGKVNGFVRSVVYYCANSIQRGTATLIGRSRSEPAPDPANQVSPPKSEAKDIAP
jgi:serine/threonine protein kinase